VILDKGPNPCLPVLTLKCPEDLGLSVLLRIASLPLGKLSISRCLLEKGKRVSLGPGFADSASTGHKPETRLLLPCVDFSSQPHLEAKIHKCIAKPDNSLLSSYVKRRGEKMIS